MWFINWQAIGGAQLAFVILAKRSTPFDDSDIFSDWLIILTLALASQSVLISLIALVVALVKRQDEDVASRAVFTFFGVILSLVWLGVGAALSYQWTTSANKNISWAIGEDSAGDCLSEFDDLASSVRLLLCFSGGFVVTWVNLLMYYYNSWPA